jgi:RNA polymerase sigma-70 factor (ECF subfamily)
MSRSTLRFVSAIAFGPRSLNSLDIVRKTPLEESKTSITLLNRIRTSSDNDGAWLEFVQRYGVRIYRWCVHRNLQPSNAEDVSQEVLLILARQMKEFQYDPTQSFRGWLHRVTENAVNRFFRDRGEDQAKGGSSIVAMLSVEPARIELNDYLAEAFDLELRDEAKSRVQKRVNEIRWKSWEMLTSKALSGKQVAAALGITVGVAYSNKHQVQKLIREEIELLENGSGIV